MGMSGRAFLLFAALLGSCKPSEPPAPPAASDPAAPVAATPPAQPPPVEPTAAKAAAPETPGAVLPGDPKHLLGLTEDSVRVGLSASSTERMWALCKGAEARLNELKSAVTGRKAAPADELSRAHALIVADSIAPLLSQRERDETLDLNKRDMARRNLKPQEDILAGLASSAEADSREAVQRAVDALRPVIVFLNSKSPSRLKSGGDFEAPRAEIVPGSPGHTIKMTRELVGLGLVSDAEQRVALLLQGASERIRELERLQQSGAHAWGAALAASYVRYMQVALTAIESAAAEGIPMTNAANAYGDAAARHAEAWSPLLEKAAAEDRDAIAQAAQMSRRGREDAKARLERGRLKGDRLARSLAKIKETNEGPPPTATTDPPAPPPVGQPEAPRKTKAPTAAPPTKVSTISKGRRYSMRDHLVPGYVTVLYFTADW